MGKPYIGRLYWRVIAHTKNGIYFVEAACTTFLALMIEVRTLSKSYGAERAVDAISFEVAQGEIIGFLGPNGAGKTTTMKVITGYLPPTEGTALINGLNVSEHPLEIREQIGYLPESTPLYSDMVTWDYLAFVAAMRGIPKERHNDRIVEMARACGLREVLAKRIDTLSKGYRQRVGLAQAMIHDPPILILDEPTSGLDPNQIVEIRELIRSIGHHKTVVLSTHILPEVQVSCDRVIIINQGRIVADGSPDELQSSLSGEERIEFSVRASEEDVSRVLSDWDAARMIDRTIDTSGELQFTLAAERDIRADLFRLAVAHGWTLTGLTRKQSSLEDVFRQLTTS